MSNRNRELVPDIWSLVRERALTTGLFSEGWYSERSGVCRRADLPGRSVKVKQFWKVDGSLMRNDLKWSVISQYLVLQTIPVYMYYVLCVCACMCVYVCVCGGGGVRARACLSTCLSACVCVCVGRTRLEPVSIIILSVVMTLASVAFIRESVTRVISLVADPTDLPTIELLVFLTAGGTVGESSIGPGA